MERESDKSGSGNAIKWAVVASVVVVVAGLVIGVLALSGAFDGSRPPVDVSRSVLSYGARLHVPGYKKTGTVWITGSRTNGSWSIGKITIKAEYKDGKLVGIPTVTGDVRGYVADARKVFYNSSTGDIAIGFYDFGLSSTSFSVHAPHDFETDGILLEASSAGLGENGPSGDKMVNFLTDSTWNSVFDWPEKDAAMTEVTNQTWVNAGGTEWGPTDAVVIMTSLAERGEQGDTPYYYGPKGAKVRLI